MKFFFFIICILVFLFKTQTVFSNSSIYNVNNIEVSAKINNVSDKKKLIQSAFQKAFITFVNKTLLKDDALNLHKTKINIIEDLVFTYQIIQNQKNEKKETVLILNIKFDQKEINNFLAKNSVSYADVSNISLTLLPVLVKDKSIFVFSDNFFYNNWVKAQDEIINTNDILVTYNLALESIEDFQYINTNKENLESIDIKKLSAINGADNYAFLVIYFSEDKLRAYLKSSIKNKEIDKNFNLRIYPENEIKTYEKAIKNIKEEISQIWKSQNLIDVNTPSFLDLFLEIKQTNDYLELRNIFETISLVESYSVLEMTNGSLKVRLKYKGKLNNLRDKLLEKKISVKIQDNIWKAKIN